jgi:hypothetical protein
MGKSDRFGRQAESAPRAVALRFDRGTIISVGIAVTAAGALAAVAVTAGGSAMAAGRPGQGARLVAPDAAATVSTASADGYQFVELGSHKDRTYNQLYGVNNHGRIAGSYGSGNGGHPNKGYTMIAPYSQGAITSENFPHSAQTQVFGLNDNNVQVGDYSNQNKSNPIQDTWFGWYYNGSFHKVEYPTKQNSSPVDDQLEGLNNHDIAVGIYENSSHRFQSFTFNIKTGKYAALTIPGSGGENFEAFGINNAGDVVGEAGDEGFIKLAGGAVHKIDVPGAAQTFATGVNDNDTVVGTYIDGTGSSETFHGFIWRFGGSLFTNIDDPNADGESFLNSINNEGDLVGGYLDASGHTDGYLAFPAF